jgi:Pretoxin HINT domain
VAFGILYPDLSPHYSIRLVLFSIVLPSSFFRAKEGDKRLRPKETKEQAEARVKNPKAEAQRRGYCFVQGTLIQTPEGPRQIETLASGQLVLAKGEGGSVREYAVVEHMRSSTLTLYHLEISGTLKLATTGNHPFYIPGRGWTKAKDLVIGDQLLSLTREIVIVTKKSRARLVEPVNTFNLHVDEVHNYFVGNGPAVLVHNGPVNNPALEDGLIWGLGAKGPRQRMPSPGDPTSQDPKLREPITGDTDGASGWRTNSTDGVGRFLGVRNIEGGTGNHGAITEAQLASKGLVAVNTEGTGALAEAGFQHVSIRPQSNSDANIPLTRAEMDEVITKLEELTPVAQNKPADFLC